MNKFKLICRYCDHSWEANYVPQGNVYCAICKDSNIRIIDNTITKVDYYIGCPPFKEEPDPIKWTFQR